LRTLTFVAWTLTNTEDMSCANCAQPIDGVASVCGTGGRHTDCSDACGSSSCPACWTAAPHVLLKDALGGAVNLLEHRETYKSMCGKDVASLMRMSALIKACKEGDATSELLLPPEVADFVRAVSAPKAAAEPEAEPTAEPTAESEEAAVAEPDAESEADESEADKSEADESDSDGEEGEEGEEGDAMDLQLLPQDYINTIDQQHLSIVHRTDQRSTMMDLVGHHAAQSQASSEFHGRAEDKARHYSDELEEHVAAQIAQTTGDKPNLKRHMDFVRMVRQGPIASTELNDDAVPRVRLHMPAGAKQGSMRLRSSGDAFSGLQTARVHVIDEQGAVPRYSISPKTKRVKLSTLSFEMCVCFAVWPPVHTDTMHPRRLIIYCIGLAHAKSRRYVQLPPIYAHDAYYQVVPLEESAARQGKSAEFLRAEYKDKEDDIAIAVANAVRQTTALTRGDMAKWMTNSREVVLCPDYDKILPHIDRDSKVPTVAWETRRSVVELAPYYLKQLLRGSGLDSELSEVDAAQCYASGMGLAAWLMVGKRTGSVSLADLLDVHNPDYDWEAYEPMCNTHNLYVSPDNPELRTLSKKDRMIYSMNSDRLTQRLCLLFSQYDHGEPAEVTDQDGVDAKYLGDVRAMCESLGLYSRELIKCLEQYSKRLRDVTVTLGTAIAGVLGDDVDQSLLALRASAFCDDAEAIEGSTQVIEKWQSRETSVSGAARAESDKKLQAISAALAQARAETEAKENELKQSDLQRSKEKERRLELEQTMATAECEQASTELKAKCWDYFTRAVAHSGLGFASPSVNKNGDVTSATNHPLLPAGKEWAKLHAVIGEAAHSTASEHDKVIAIVEMLNDATARLSTPRIQSLYSTRWGGFHSKAEAVTTAYLRPEQFEKCVTTLSKEQPAKAMAQAVKELKLGRSKEAYAEYTERFDRAVGDGYDFRPFNVGTTAKDVGFVDATSPKKRVAEESPAGGRKGKRAKGRS
jgi:hypothetical protein